MSNRLLSRYAGGATGALKTALWALLCLCLHAAPSAAAAATTLQLAWKHQFQFAGYYAALHKGFYRQAGLDVRIIEGGEGKFAREEVLGGRAQYGVAGAELILHRMDGDPFVVLAPIFQHSASILLARKDAGISTLHDLIGKRVMLLPENKDADILAAFLNEGAPLDAIRRLDQTYNLNDLIEGRTDAVSAYLTNEPWRMRREGVEPAVISPRTYGVDFYSDCLFTTENEIEKRPRRVRAFLAASLQGWEYAVAHPEEIIDLLITRYGVRKSRDHLRYEAETIRELMLPDLVQIGHMNPDRWRHIADTYVRLGLLGADFSLEGFLFAPDPGADYARLKRFISAALVISVLSGAGLLILLFFNRKLRKEIDERKQAEASLKDREAFLDRLIDQSPFATWISDAEGTLQRANPALKNFLNLTDAQLVGRYNVLRDPLVERQGIMPLVRSVFEDGKTVNLTCDWDGNDIPTLDLKGSNSVSIEATMFPIHDHDGRLTNVVLNWIDVTARKQAEAALRRSQTHLRTLVDALPDLIWLKDPDGVYLACNSRFEKFFGAKESDIIGKTDYDFVDGALADFFREKDRLAMAADKPCVNEEEITFAHDGHVELLETIKTPMYDAEGRLVGVLGIGRDITARKRMEARIQQTQKMESVGNLAGGIAHDFNNILFPIIGLSELLADDLDPGSQQHENAREINKAGKRGGDLVKQILAFSRQSEHQKIPVRIQRILKEVLFLIRSTIPSDIDIADDIQSDCNLVLADPTQIHQIAMNLMTNAYHAAEHTGGGISLRLRETAIEGDDAAGLSIDAGRYVVLSVSDAGCGMEQAVMDKIFEPYFTTKPQGKGTGLGLAVVYGIVKEHHGDIKVYSEPGKGSTFSVYLPVMETTSDSVKTERPEGIQTGNESILLVDDETAIARLERQMLERLGYRVTSCTDSLDALAAFAAAPAAFDLVMTDMTMPNMTGDLLALKLTEIRQDIPVIICTGFSERMDEEKAKAIGVKGFLMKPVIRTDLARLVRKTLDAAKTSHQTEFKDG